MVASMGTGSGVLGSALRLVTGRADGGCRLVFTDAVLHDTIPKIFVVFTDARGASAALRSAAAWASRLNFGIDLIVPQVVPYPLPAARPAVSIEFTLGEIRRVTMATGIAPDVHVYLCRDPLQTVTEVLPAHSVVVIGARKTWFPSAAARLARQLERRGHVAILAKYA